jgi:hypothetical protein
MHYLTGSVQLGLRHLTKKSHAKFLLERGRVQETQARILKTILRQSLQTAWGRENGLSAEWDAKDVAKNLKPTTWQDWEPWVERERRGEARSLAVDVQRYQPTSGSTFKRKWVPYTKSFLREIDQATAVWMHDLYQNYPGLLRGRHYWSLSWLPDDLRSQMSNNDLAYFPWLKRQFLAQIMAVPERVQHATSAHDAREQTIHHLLRCRDLSLLFVWSPTFLLGLCEELWDRRAVPHATSMEDMVQRLWPKLALISAWDTADAAPWAAKVKNLFPHTKFQGKGLFATEAVVTIPVQERPHLAYSSHYYEFQRTDGVIVPSWELRGGDRVTPLVSTGSGLWRYQLGDELLVEEVYQGCPVLQFLGRQQTVDLVGEKLTYQVARNILQDLGHGAFLMLAVQGNEDTRPYYELVWEGAAPAGLSQKVESLLAEHHHYRLARELGQLLPLRVHTCQSSGHFFRELAEQMGWVLGDMKWEALVKLPHSHKVVAWNP